MLDQRGRIVDELLVLQAENKGTIVADAAGVNSSNAAAVFNTGGGFIEGDLVIDIHFAASAVSQSAGYIALQGSTTSSFSTKVELGRLYFGKTTRSFAGKDVTSGRFIRPFNNMFGDAIYQYLRVYCKGLGTWATGIDYAAFISPK